MAGANHASITRKVLDTSSITDTVAPARTDISAPSGGVAFKRHAVVGSCRQANGHRARGDWTATVNLQQGDIAVPERLLTDVLLVNDEVTHVERQFIGVGLKSIELAD